MLKTSAFVILTFAFCASVHAASFNCAKARTRVEKAICADPVISRLDGELAKAFKAALPCYADPEVLRTDQKAWIRDVRDRAKGKRAMKAAYEARLKDLLSWTCPEYAAGEVSLRLVRYKDLDLPVLTKGASPEVLKMVNGRILALGESLGCSEPDPKEEAGARNQERNWSTSHEVAYGGREIFSLSVHSSYWCGSAYPTNDANQSMTFDLRRGELISFEDLFRDYQADKTAILTAIFGEAWRKTENKEAFNLATVGEHGVAFVLRENGLEAQPSFPHVIEAAAETVLAPYKAVLPFAKPGGLLTRVVGGGSVNPSVRP